MNLRCTTTHDAPLKKENPELKGACPTMSD